MASTPNPYQSPKESSPTPTGDRPRRAVPESSDEDDPLRGVRHFLVWLSLIGIFLALELPRINKAPPDQSSDYVWHAVAFGALGCAALIRPIGWILQWLLRRQR